MRGRRRKPGISQTRIGGERTEAREGLERRWSSRIELEQALAPDLTAKQTRREPFHRWIVFKQAFAPDLVRRFLKSQHGMNGDPTAGPILDPFSGTGTVVLECARKGFSAVGVEAIRSLVFVTQSAWIRNLPDPPQVVFGNSLEEWADNIVDPAHRAALICAISARITSRGTVNASAPPIGESFREIVQMMAEDLRHPLAQRNLVINGDGRRLEFFADESFGGLLTSPPYLSRHDYTRIARAFEEVYARWFGSEGVIQIPASTNARVRPDATSIPESVREAADALELVGHRSMAQVTRSYFANILEWIDACRRVLRPGSPCWIAIGGARIKDVHIPTDIILAEHAQSNGFDVIEIKAARRVTQSERRFGRLTRVAPRESILVLRRK